MKPHRNLAETKTPDGGRFTLHEHDGTYCIRLNGQELMHSSTAVSELQLGELAARPFSGRSSSSFLIGGLGLGFTLKGVLGQAGSAATVQVAEVVPEVIAWNREFLGRLNGSLLDDSRVEIFVEDVCDLIWRAGPDRYDAIVLDTDNGPTAMVQKSNARLYNRRGIQRIAAALKAGGCLAVWSARPDRGFSDRLAAEGFKVKIIPVKLYATAKRCAGSIYQATLG